jgi:uncharacterized protein (DUF2141 family)
MKMVLITGLIVLLFVSIGVGQEDGGKGELTIILNGFESQDGNAMIALCDSQEDYEAEDQPFLGKENPINGNQSIWTIEDLQFGEYAIKVFHDEDDDGEMDTNFLGMPSENYGFSNDARGSFGPASWEDAKFLFNSAKDTVLINIE